MPKHENSALQKKFYNQFEKGTFSVKCAPNLFDYQTLNETNAVC